MRNLSRENLKRNSKKMISIPHFNRKRRLSLISNSLDLSTSHGRSVGNSFKRESFMDLYNFSLESTRSESNNLEDKFCKDFVCCGLELQDLHDLLHHFEEYHHVDARFDSDEELFEFEAAMDDSDSSGSFESPITFTDIYLKSAANYAPSRAIALSEIYKDPNSKKRHSDDDFYIDDMEIDFIPNPLPTPGIEGDEDKDRPYKCKVNGCVKSYKNPGGLKYHMQHGHCEDTGDPEMNNIIFKPYECTVVGCGRRYKNLNGLKVKNLEIKSVLVSY